MSKEILKISPVEDNPHSRFVLLNLLSRCIFRFACKIESLITDHPVSGNLFHNEVFDI